MVDALFFSVVTMTTVGYGDLAPTSNGSRFFTCFYMLFGVVFIFTQTQARNSARNYWARNSARNCL